MDNNEVANKCLKTFIVVIVAVMVFFLFVYPQVNNNKENFSAEEKASMLVNNSEQLNASLEELDLQHDGSNNNIPVSIEGPSGEKLEKLPENYYFLDDGSGGKMSIQHNLCSKSCCSEQYPTPFKLKYDGNVCANKNKYVPSQIMCNNAYQDSGCLCMTKDQAKFLNNRGGNGNHLQ